MIWRVPLTVFEGDNEAAAAGVFRRAHIASFHSNAQMVPADEDTTQAPIMMPRMMPSANPAVPEVSIRRVRLLGWPQGCVRAGSRRTARAEWWTATLAWCRCPRACPTGWRRATLRGRSTRRRLRARRPTRACCWRRRRRRSARAWRRRALAAAARRPPRAAAPRQPRAPRPACLESPAPAAPPSAAAPRRRCAHLRHVSVPDASPGFAHAPDAPHRFCLLHPQELQSGIAGVLAAGGLQAGYQSGAVAQSRSQGDLSLARSKARGGSSGQLPPRASHR